MTDRFIYLDVEYNYLIIEPIPCEDKILDLYSTNSSQKLKGNVYIIGRYRENGMLNNRSSYRVTYVRGLGDDYSHAPPAYHLYFNDKGQWIVS